MYEGFSDDEIYTAKLFLDADLSVLGWSDSEYEDYSKRIWQEYSYYDRKA